MPYVGILSSFDHTTDTWSTYKSRLTQWFIANEIDEDASIKRRAILLSALTDATYKLAANLVYPEDIQDLPYEGIVKVLDEHFTPKRHGFTNRHNFYAAVQKSGESYQDWAVRLRGLAEHCGFSNVEEALRDRFVMGSIAPAREKLYEQDFEKLTLTDAVYLAEGVRCAHEASNANDSPAPSGKPDATSKYAPYVGEQWKSISKPHNGPWGTVSGSQTGKLGGQSGTFGGQSGTFGGQSGTFGGQSGPFGAQPGTFGGQSGTFGGQSGATFGSQPQSSVFGTQPQTKSPIGSSNQSNTTSGNIKINP